MEVAGKIKMEETFLVVSVITMLVTVKNVVVLNSKLKRTYHAINVDLNN